MPPSQPDPEAPTLPPPTTISDDDGSDEEASSPPSAFDRFQSDFPFLLRLVSDIQNSFDSSSPADATTNIQLTTLEQDAKHIVNNVNYINRNLHSLQICSNGDKAEELLSHLMDAARNQSACDFETHSENLHHLLQIVSKLKHWVPPQRPEESGNAKKTNFKKKKESPIVSNKDKENAVAEIVKTLVGYKCEEWGMDGLLRSYRELGNRTKLCLLCFSVFPCEVEKVKTKRIKDKDDKTVKTEQSKDEDEDDKTLMKMAQSKEEEEKPVLVQRNLVIKKKILIYWWVGEGFIDIPPPPETLDSVPISSDLKNPCVGQNVGENLNSIEERGEEILTVLKEKGFIEPVMKRGMESGSYQMHPFVHSFVTALAKREGLFDFRDEDNKLTASFVQSHRACLLKSQGNSLSSCKIWKEFVDDLNKLKKFETVQTLFNVNEPIIDIKPEWFSKMKYLSVLHLGSWRSETADHIEVLNPKFLEDLKGMMQLKLFSLQGVSTIMKLPDSVCNLKNLIILDLRECHNLEELPADIGSLKNLTHLDITNCHLLTKLPQGISLLSKLEVLNGFVIYNQDEDCEEQEACILSPWWKKTKRCVVHDLFRRKNKKLCTLRDLLNLVCLRELSLVVNRDNFPNPREVQVFKEMRRLRSLKISWEKSFDNVNPNLAARQEPPSKCGWSFPGNNPVMENTDRGVEQQVQNANGQPRQKFLDQIIKLELWCCPEKSAPKWLVPSELKKLQKLYIKGGNITCLGEDGDKWNVETLRLKYLRNLKIEWRKLLEMFPRMTYLEKFECKRLGLFPCDHEGVWKKKGSKSLQNH